MKKRVEVRTKLKKLQCSAHSYVFCFFMFLLIFPVTACVFNHVWTNVCELNHMCLFRCDFHTFAKKSWFCGKNTWFYGIAGFSKSIKNYVFDNVQLLTWIYKKIHNIFPLYEKYATEYTPTLEPYTCSFIFYCINITFSGSFWPDIGVFFKIRS